MDEVAAFAALRWERMGVAGAGKGITEGD